MNYNIKKAIAPPSLGAGWDSGDWGDANVAEVNNFHEESSDHHPETKVKLIYTENGIHGLFKVKDKYVRCVNTENQSQVCGDSCVEFFFKPHVGNGYFNLECNCGGTILCYYVTDPTRVPGKGLNEFVKLTAEECSAIKISHTLPKIVEPEIKEEIDWELGFFFPFAIIRRYSGDFENVSTKEWRANFYKCGDKTSHPHWGSWSPVGECNFHQPECFGKIAFLNK